MGNLADACTLTGLQPGNAAGAGDAGAGSIAGGATGAITGGN